MMLFQDVFSILLIIIGTALMLISAIGIIRFPDFYLRMSAITKAATLGLFLLLIGLAVFFNRPGLSIKSFIIITLILLTNPVGAHAIARAAYMSGTNLWEGNIINELKEMTDRKTELEQQLKELPGNREIMNELVVLYKTLPTAQGGSLEKAEMMEKELN
ncbi:MAG TPA: monovalent cation/H(+) antiporter subunit G [Dysgonamonadaceae bacterium]|nr:monovalent cation/H(+) antiporter subunit G [Dysgonamonadaceae bacterium]